MACTQHQELDRQIDAAAAKLTVRIGQSTVGNPTYALDALTLTGNQLLAALAALREHEHSHDCS